MTGYATQLSNGALENILQQRGPPKPVLQVLNMKKIQAEQQNVNRYRLQMSDGTNFQPCMLATQMNEKIESGELDKFSVVRVTRYLCNTIHERRIIIIINLEILCKGEEAGGAIGQPKALELLKVPNGNTAAANQGSGGGGGLRVGAGGGGGGQGYGPYNGGGGGAPPSSFPPSRPATASHEARPGGPPKPSYSTSAAPPSRPGFDVSHSQQRSVFPIASLSPYQSKWTIRVRVVSKPSIKTWSNSRGEGRVLNVDLVDETGEIRACAFNEAADKLQSQLEMGQVYYISRGCLKPANKKFSSVKNDYELNMNDDTEVELCMEGASDLPTLQYNFTSIADIESIEPNTLIDVIGICKSAAELSTVTSRSTSKQFSKRDIQLMDRSGKVVSLTIWGAEAEGFDGSKCPVIALKGCKVSDFGGRSLTTQFSSLMNVDPDIPEAHQLRGWFDSVGKNKEVTSISDQRSGGGGQAAAFLTIEQMRDLDLGHGEKPDYFNFKSTVTFSKKDNCLYKACPNQDCNKKVTEHDGQYTCEKCNQTSPNFKYRIMLAINTADHSGSQWLTCFQETASEVLGISAEDLGQLRETDEQAYDDVFQKANFKEYVFRVRAKVDTFNDEQRLKCLCVSASPVNYSQETRRRIEDIKTMLA
jgi:replication factor A1